MSSTLRVEAEEELKTLAPVFRSALSPKDMSCSNNTPPSLTASTLLPGHWSSPSGTRPPLPCCGWSCAARSGGRGPHSGHGARCAGHPSTSGCGPRVLQKKTLHMESCGDVERCTAILARGLWNKSRVNMTSRNCSWCSSAAQR